MEFYEALTRAIGESAAGIDMIESMLVFITELAVGITHIDSEA